MDLDEGSHVQTSCDLVQLASSPSSNSAR